jgi:hypothetical protein
VDTPGTGVIDRLTSEADRLRALAQYAVLDTASEPAFDDLVHLAATLMSVPWVAMNLVDDRRTWAKAAVGVPQDFEVSRDEAPFCATAIGHPSEILVIEDTLDDERYADNVMTQLGVRFYAGAPRGEPSASPWRLPVGPLRRRVVSVAPATARRADAATMAQGRRSSRPRCGAMPWRRVRGSPPALTLHACATRRWSTS